MLQRYLFSHLALGAAAMAIACAARARASNGDGVVSIRDLLELLANWGTCP
ncbi:MAG: hypothetical protein ACYS0G_14620 [Planctomycetota bacterium]|jgi:hypothetical protein